MKFSGKKHLKIILKVTKKQSLTFFLEDTFFEKPQGGGSNLLHPRTPHPHPPPSPSRFRDNIFFSYQYYVDFFLFNLVFIFTVLRMLIKSMLSF